MLSKNIFYRYCVLIFLLLGVTGCMHPSGKSNIQNLGDSYTTLSTDNIIRDLTRSEKINLGTSVAVYPLTKTLSNTTLLIESKKRGLSPQNADQLRVVSQLQQKDRSCFHFSLYSDKPDGVNLHYWGIQFIQSAKVIQGTFMDVDTPGVAITTTTYRENTHPGLEYTTMDSINSTSFYNSGTICTSKGININYLQEFQMQLLARFLPSPKAITLTWKDPKAG